MNDKMISTEEAGRQLKVSRQWVAELIRRGDLSAERVGGKWVLMQSEIDRYRAEQKKN